MKKARGRGLFQWAGGELNPRHRNFQSRALPTELPPVSGCLTNEAMPYSSRLSRTVKPAGGRKWPGCVAAKRGRFGWARFVVTPSPWGP